MYIEKILKNNLFFKKTQNIIEKTYDRTVNLTRGFKKDSNRILKELLFGIIKSNSVSLSEIGRHSYKLKKGVKLKNIVSSYSKFLGNTKTIGLFMGKYTHNVTKKLGKGGKKVFISVDGGDIVKEHSKSRNVGYVRDGSSNENKRGFLLETAVAFNLNLESVPLLGSIYSRKRKYKSDNNETRKLINKLKRYISKSLNVVYLFDRGYDAKDFFEFLSGLGIKFIVKMRKNRYVIAKGKTVWIDRAYTKLRSLKTEVEIVLKGGHRTKGKLYYGQVKIFDSNERRKYRLVVIKNNKGMHMLLTNERVSNKEEAMEVIKAYSYRWLVEETYKYLKQEYKLEYIHLRDSKKDQQLQVKRMNNLYNLVLASLGLSMLGLEMLGKQEKEFILEVRAIDYVGYKLKNLLWGWIDILKAVIMEGNFLQNRYQRYRLYYQQISLFSEN